ncbi:ubiquitin-associated domain-containing protein 2-like [Haliotis cracherodii]|uniref:ubiquitin-associated domain-containing protein 2-like n=1 Tax=Haliotis cracherodii TaxID=6455 RepID=UPI0039EB4843
MLSVYGSSGFYKAPVSKGLVWLSLAASFAFSFPLQHYKSYLLYNPQLLLEKHQIWRLLSSRVAFLDLKDLFVCCMLVYYFRIFERRFGSRKFVSYLMSSGALACGVELVSLWVCQHLEISVENLPTGPICFVFPLFVPYYFDIPRVAMTHILGVPVTGKTLTYILGLQVASPTFETRLVAVCGIIGGLLWRLNFLKVKSLVVIPRCVASMLDATLGRVLQSPPPKTPELPMGATLELQRQEQLDRLEQQMVMAFQNSQPAHRPNIDIPRPQPLNVANGPGIFGNPDFLLPPGLRQRNNMDDVPPDNHNSASDLSGPQLEEQVQRLVEMGFSQDRVRHALQVTNNDISMATNVLLQET